MFQLFFYIVLKFRVQSLFEPTDLMVSLGPLLIDSVNFASSKPSPRFIKSHLPWHLLPKSLTSGQTKAKVNPRKWKCPSVCACKRNMCYCEKISTCLFINWYESWKEMSNEMEDFVFHEETKKTCLVAWSFVWRLIKCFICFWMWICYAFFAS